MSEETFEEWYEVVFKKYKASKRMAMYGFVQLAWNHQQKKIQDLEAKLTRAVEALRFYGDTSENTWLCQLSATTGKPISYVVGIDCDELENGFVNGGKLARKTLEEIKKGE